MISTCVIPNNDWLNTDRVRTLSRSAFVDDLVHLPKGKNAEHSRASTTLVQLIVGEGTHSHCLHCRCYHTDLPLPSLIFSRLLNSRNLCLLCSAGDQVRMGRWSRQRETIQFPRLQRIQDCNEEEYLDEDDNKRNNKIVHQVQGSVTNQVWRSNVGNPRAYRKLTDGILPDDDDVDERQVKAWEDKELSIQQFEDHSSGFSNSKRTLGGWRIGRRVKLFGAAKSTKPSSRMVAVSRGSGFSLRRRLRVLLSPLRMLRKVRDAYIRTLMGIADKSNPSWSSLVKGI
jgi:hypothetical protein